MRTRAGEAARPWFRTDRFYHTNEGWWFLTREKTEKGPYVSQLEAEHELIIYIRNANEICNQFTAQQ
ncbi:DUF6316 family protein [Aliikangiella coralliicola]|uniref:DUF6316 domain-containing protein n=1 Tax=Aliikangiella coralliicola TaxID=2592383 RepID=A0A545U4X5_9GAMM|nr:DUF6316 family protein [Aliikangiella coralliicola]TQV84530.1 hypothetical protein FLL46_23240 [Aliikangiella coralliicola]